MFEMTVAPADAAARAALTKAAAIGVAMTAAVVDEAGRLVAQPHECAAAGAAALGDRC